MPRVVSKTKAAQKNVDTVRGGGGGWGEHGACQNMCAAWKLDCSQVAKRRREKETIERPREWRKYRMNEGERHIVKLFSECWDPRGCGVTVKPSMHMLCRPEGWRQGSGGEKVFVVFKWSHGLRVRGSFLITRLSSLISTCLLLFWFLGFNLGLSLFWQLPLVLFAVLYVVAQWTGLRWCVFFFFFSSLQLSFANTQQHESSCLASLVTRNWEGCSQGGWSSDFWTSPKFRFQKLWYVTKHQQN